MKIVKQGDLAKTKKILRFNCNECGCVFECFANECVAESDLRNGIEYRHDCPTCKKTVWGIETIL